MGWGQGGLHLLFPNPACVCHSGPREVAAMRERTLTPLLLTPPSPILGKHSSPKDEISPDS